MRDVLPSKRNQQNFLFIRKERLVGWLFVGSDMSFKLTSPTTQQGFDNPEPDV